MAIKKPLVLDGNGRIQQLQSGDSLDFTICAPPSGTDNQLRAFTGYFGTAGVDSGITNMNVDGSTTPVTFFIAASSDYDIHIQKIQIQIVDNGNGTHDQFGNLAGLSAGTGVWFLSVESGDIVTHIADLRSNGQLLSETYWSERPSWGSTSNTLRITNYLGTQETWLGVYNFCDLIPGGFRVGRGTTDAIGAIVRANLTGLTSLTFRAFGYKKYPCS